MGHDESRRQERRRLIDDLREQGASTKPIALALCERYGVERMTAFRWANDLSLAEAAKRYNKVRDDPDEKMTGARISEWERWPQPRSRRPPVDALVTLSAVYKCHVGDLIDAEDHGWAEASGDGEPLQETALEAAEARMPRQEKPSFRQERRRRIGELRQRGATTKQIARTLAHDYNESLLKAFRWAHDWSLEEAAERYNNDVADDPEQGAITFQRLSNHENWPRSANSHPPSIALLQGLAKLYHCAPGDLIEGTDHTFQAERPAPTPATAVPPALAGHDLTLDQTALWDAEAAARKQAGEALGRLRREAGLSQHGLANRIGYARGHVAGAETGANRTAPEFWERCDAVLAAAGALVAAGARIRAAQEARARAVVLRDEAAREARLQQWRAEHGLPDAVSPGSAESTLPELMRDDAMLVAPPLSGSDVQRRAFSRLLLTGGITAAGMALAEWFPDPAGGIPEHASQLDATIHIGRIRDRLIRYESIEGRPTSEPVDRATLERQVVDTWRAFQRSDYSTLGDRLPDLIDRTRLAVCESDGADTFRTAELQSETLQLTAILLLKLGASNLAWVAADRAMFAAERAQNYLTIASAARILAYALLGAGHHGKAKELCLGAAARLEDDLDSSSPEHLSAYGALLLKAGMGAAMQDDRAATNELLGLAGQVADRLGRDGNWLWTAFGPTNVAVHRVSAAVELGDAGAAIDYAKQVPHDRLPVLERRAHHLIDVARANGQRRRNDDALAALLDAEQLAPEEVHVSPYVHALVVDLLGRTTRRAGELRGLAERVRVLA